MAEMLAIPELCENAKHPQICPLRMHAASTVSE